MPYRWTTKAEAVDVGFHRIEVNACFFQSLEQHRGIMYPLGSGENLFSSEEDVERV